MAWSWSHTPEAYDNAHDNLLDLPVDTLRVIYKEWRTHILSVGQDDAAWLATYENASNFTEMSDMTNREIADAIWEWANEQRTCDNGGWNAWMCPYGCHTVPFDRSEVAA